MTGIEKRIKRMIQERRVKRVEDRISSIISTTVLLTLISWLLL